jgi:hypothetical protein
MRVKETVLKISVSVSSDRLSHLNRIEDMLSVFTSDSSMIINSLSLTTNILGQHGISSARVERYTRRHDGLEVIIAITHRGSLEHSLRCVNERFKDYTVVCSLIKKE